MHTPARTEDYVAVWRRVLRGWLSWPEPRIERFIQRFRPFAEPETRTDRTPVWFLTHVLEPPSLRQRYQVKDRIRIDFEIEVAIVGEGSAAHLQPSFDWEAARERVTAVLTRYGASLPNPQDLAWWENELENKA
jgi:hypothetical protein